MSPGLIVIILIIVAITSIVKKINGKKTVFTDVPAPIKKQYKTSQSPSVDNLQITNDDALSMHQKYAAMGVLFFFYGYCHDTLHAQQATEIIENAANALKVSKEDALEYCNQYLNNADELIENVKNINSLYWRRYIMRESSKLVQMEPSAKPIFFAMAHEVGLSFSDL